MNAIDMQVKGDTDDKKAKSLVRAMLEAGLRSCENVKLPSPFLKIGHKNP
ncbi:MAG: hypothetical protein AAFX99_15400 [Myxococcota bacterium]